MQAITGPGTLLVRRVFTAIALLLFASRAVAQDDAGIYNPTPEPSPPSVAQTGHRSDPSYDSLAHTRELIQLARRYLERAQTKGGSYDLFYQRIAASDFVTDVQSIVRDAQTSTKDSAVASSATAVAQKLESLLLNENASGASALADALGQLDRALAAATPRTALNTAVPTGVAAVSLKSAYETLASYMKVTAVREPAHAPPRILFYGSDFDAESERAHAREHGWIGCKTEGAGGDGKQAVGKEVLCASYDVARDASVLVEFAIPPELEFSALISVRARILRSTPVELPVDNYTVVTRNELDKAELVAAPGDVFHGRKRLRRLELESQARAVSVTYQEFADQLVNTFRAGPVGDWLPSPELMDALDQFRTTISDFRENLSNDFASSQARLMLVPSNDTYERTRNDLNALLNDVQLLYTASQKAASAAARAKGCASDKAGQQCRWESRNALRDALQSGAFAVEWGVERLLGKLDRLFRTLRDGVRDEGLRRMKPAIVHLDAADLEHNDTVELIVKASMERLALSDDDSTEEEFLTYRFRMRIVDLGFSYAIGPQFGMIKRISDVREATAKDSPSNFRPAPGGAIQFRYRTYSRASDWLLPSVGAAAFVLDFDPSQAFELGVGPSVGLLNGMVHGGAGWNLFVTDHRMYWFLSLDFLQTIESFGPLFGGSKEEGE